MEESLNTEIESDMIIDDKQVNISGMAYGWPFRESRKDVMLKTMPPNIHE